MQTDNINLQGELEQLRAELLQYRSTQADIVNQMGSLNVQQQATEDQRSYWERLAREVESEKAALEARLLAAQGAATDLDGGRLQAQSEEGRLATFAQVNWEQPATLRRHSVADGVSASF